jgi:hypothetical protein
MDGSGGCDVVCTSGGVVIPCFYLPRGGAGVTPAGRIRGEAILTRFSRLVSPDNTVTWDFATPHCLPRKLRSCSLALPSTGGAVSRIFRAFPSGPAISSCAARGWMRRWSIRSEPSQRYHEALICQPSWYPKLAMGATRRIFSNCSTIKATNGEKSIPEKAGRIRRAGASRGSAILCTRPIKGL